jgi:pimeloyl-ACP methyl ester carboxylesterase
LAQAAAWILEDDLLGHFAADIDPVKAKVMYTVQRPLTMSAFDDAMGTLAWRSLPSWYLVAEHDEVIRPDAERQFAQRMGADTTEVASGHVAMVSHPEETYERIVTAAKKAAAAPAQAQRRTGRASRSK